MKRKNDDYYIIQDIVLKRADRQGIKTSELAEMIGTYPQMVNNWRHHHSQMSMQYAERCFEALNEHAKKLGFMVY